MQGKLTKLYTVMHFMLSIIIRTVMMYIAVTVAIRLMGKRQIGDLQPNELVITLLISEIAAIPLQDINQPVLVGILAISVLIILEIISSVISLKSISLRKIMNGKSVVIIKNGTVDQKAMQDVRMTVLDLLELLRAKDIFELSDVNYAVLEVNGELSVLKNEKPKTGLPLPVIADGKIINESLNALNVDKKEIMSILNKKALSEKDVFLLMLDRYGNITIIKKDI